MRIPKRMLMYFLGGVLVGLVIAGILSEMGIAFLGP